MKKNCAICGTPLFVIKKGEEWFCPNHGIIIENQDWNSLSVKEIKKKKIEKKKNDN